MTDKKLIAEEISTILWELDPMTTCCNANEGMENEYSSEAAEITSLANSGMPVRQAVQEVFEKWFWEDCLLSDDRLPLLEQMVSALAETPSPNAQSADQ